MYVVPYSSIWVVSICLLVTTAYCNRWYTVETRDISKLKGPGWIKTESFKKTVVGQDVELKQMSKSKTVL